MLKGVIRHVRRQPVAFVALFFALGGTAVAASDFIKSTDTIPAGDLAGSTYGNPLIKSGAVTSSKLADGAVTTSKFGANAIAPNSDKLDGKDSTDFLTATGKAADSDKLDGKDSTDFLGSTAKAADSDKLDGKDSTDFVPAGSVLPSVAVLSDGDTETLFSADGVSVVGDCSDGTHASIVLRADGTVGNVIVVSSVASATGAPTNVLLANGSATLLSTSGSDRGEFNADVGYFTGGAKSVNGSYSAHKGGNGCFYTGYGIAN